MDHTERWRLILGSKSDPEGDIPLDGNAAGMDGVLDALYDPEKKGGLGASTPRVNRWLGDIRRYFPTPVVQVMQRDALDRLGLQQLLLEPEILASIEPDVHLVAALLSLNKVMPDKSRASAREVVRQIVEQLQKKLRQPLLQALNSALHRTVRNRRPRSSREIDWNRTIRQNLRHYQPALGILIPEHFVGFGRKGQALRHILLLVDQSGSMASSIVYAAVYGAVLASLHALKTRMIVFDTAVADLTEHLHDPVELLFGTQLGGGTDIHKALAYAQTQVGVPRDTILVLISDLFEGGNRQQMLRSIRHLQESGATIVVLLTLSDDGAPAYDHENAAALAAMGIPAFACTPDYFPELMAQAISGRPLRG
jgi:Mg-chelatase subunit ChlD